MQIGILHPLIIAAALPATSFGQSTFQNLDFELANIQPGQLPGLVSATDAIPGWTPYIGTNQGSGVLFDQLSTGAAAIVLLDARGGSIEGSFSVTLQGGLANSPGSPGGVAPAEASIRQTGQVPVGTQAILLKAQPSLIPLSVSLAGQSISMSALGAGPNYTLFGGDISAFAGQTVELKIAALPSNNYWNIDSIEFSASTIPEPGAVALAAIGFALLAMKSARGNKSGRPRCGERLGSDQRSNLHDRRDRHFGRLAALVGAPQ